MKKNTKLQFLAILLIAVLTLSCSDEHEDTKEIETPVEQPTTPDKPTAPSTGPKVDELRTAKDVAYLSKEEKEIFFFLNYARKYPKEFSEKYVVPYTMAANIMKPYAYDERKKSLEAELASMKPVGLIYPDEEMYALAECFATQSGNSGAIGHSRSGTSCTDPMRLGITWAENISYGFDTAKDIIIQLLIDAGENNAALGHRKTNLNPNYNRMGVSVKPHRAYRHNAVMDFTSR